MKKLMKVLNNTFFYYHNNNGETMKKLIIILSLILIDNVSASNLYVSKRDIYTKDYINDCDFLLYDENKVVVDAWIQDNNTHEVTDIKNGTYILEERPKIELGNRDNLSVFHEIDINNNSIELVLYNSKIETPRNLDYNLNLFTIGCFIIFFGILIIYIGYRKYYLE